VKVLVDGLAFQLDGGNADRFWQPVLNGLGLCKNIELMVLDRGNTPPIPAADLIGFPSYTATYTPADSLMIERVARHYDADVFFSTGCSTPIQTPSIAVVSERHFDQATFATRREWLEVRLVLRHASRFLCLSDRAREKLHSEFRGQLSATQSNLVSIEAPSASRGLSADSRFDDIIRPLVELLTEVASAHRGGQDRIFYERWAALRKLQQDVDA
jgi:hypothetical protein